MGPSKSKPQQTTLNTDDMDSPTRARRKHLLDIIDGQPPESTPDSTTDSAKQSSTNSFPFEPKVERRSPPTRDSGSISGLRKLIQELDNNMRMPRKGPSEERKHFQEWEEAKDKEAKRDKRVEEQGLHQVELEESIADAMAEQTQKNKGNAAKRNRRVEEQGLQQVELEEKIAEAMIEQPRKDKGNAAQRG